MPYLKVNLLFIILFTGNVFTQVLRTQEISKEVKYPISIIGSEDDDVNFCDPILVHFDELSKHLFILEGLNHRVTILDTNLFFIRHFGNFGQGSSEFNRPLSLDTDNKGNIIIQDLNKRIQVFNPNFEQISNFNHKFVPMNLSCENDGNILLNSGSSGKLFTILDYEGDFVNSFGDLMLKKDNSHLYNGYNQVYFEIDYNGDIYCAFTYNAVFRKYNRYFNMVYEMNYDDLEMIQN
ncbi:hypothetical protein ACFL4T_09905, partial [candidate division KSB1 bacterium]